MLINFFFLHFIKSNNNSLLGEFIFKKKFFFKNYSSSIFLKNKQKSNTIFYKNFFFYKNLFFYKIDSSIFLSKYIKHVLYTLPFFFKKYFGVNNYIQDLYNKSLYTLYFFFIWDYIFYFIKYFFLYIPIKNHRYLYIFMKIMFSQKVFSKKLIFLKTIIKGKFSVYGDARKRKAIYKIGPLYDIHPRNGLKAFFLVKIGYCTILTNTGLSNIIGLIKHTH